MNEKGLGKRLQEARQAAGLTQQQLCQQANLSFSTLTKIERGAIKSPSIFTIQSIAEALGLGLDELVGSGLGSTARSLQVTKDGAKFIYFDVNGCLIDFFQGAFTQLARDTGVSAGAVEDAFWSYNSDACKGLLSLDEFNQKLATRLGLTSVDWEKYYLESVRPIPEMQELLLWASKHYKVGLLTNIMPGLLRALQNNGTLPKIDYDVVIDSSEVGAIKPNDDMYKIAQDQAGCPAGDILLIDDSRPNVMAAQNAGWHVLWFNFARPTESVASVREALEPAE